MKDVNMVSVYGTIIFRYYLEFQMPCMYVCVPTYKYIHAYGRALQRISVKAQ